jgi:YaiO family outer membrane protein
VSARVLLLAAALAMPPAALPAGSPYGNGAPVRLKLAQGLPQAPDADAAAEHGGRSRRVELEIGASRETLTSGLPDWSGAYFEATNHIGPRHTLYGGLRQTRRFSRDDVEAWGGLYYPLSATWTGFVEATASPSHNVLPVWSLSGQLHKILLRGLIVHAGARHVEHAGSDVRMAVAGAEYYWSNYRAAYTFHSSRLEGAGSAPAHRFQLNYYYGDRSSIGIAYTTGREIENVGAPRGLIASEVRDWTLGGRHWFSRDWGVSWDLLTHEQGALYRRDGFRIGLRHRF